MHINVSIYLYIYTYIHTHTCGTEGAEHFVPGGCVRHELAEGDLAVQRIEHTHMQGHI